MATPIVAQGTRIFIESARGAVQTVDAITKADPPVLTYQGADPADNSYLILRHMAGMGELEDSVHKVASVNTVANTLELKDQDSSLFGTFISGEMLPVTFGTELLLPTGFSTSGGEPQYANYMLLWDNIERQIFTHTSAVGIEIPLLFDPTDPTYQALYNLTRTAATLAVKFLFKSGVEMLAFGNFGGSGMPTASDTRSVMNSNFTISLISKPVYVLP